jgi:hypothetical protein
MPRRSAKSHRIDSSKPPAPRRGLFASPLFARKRPRPAPPAPDPRPQPPRAPVFMYTLSIHTIDILVFSSYHENEHLFTWAAFSFNFRAMRALILAPTNPTLPDVAAEAAAVANAHPGSRLLQGAISEGDIAQAVAPGGFDLFWLATHGNRDGVLLTRETLAASALITYVAASGACTVMLNTCDSIHLAAQIVDSTPASVVATIQDLPDSDAARTGALFAAQLAAHSDPRTAYERSKPGKNRTYVYLANARPTTPRTQGHAQKARRTDTQQERPKARLLLARVRR